MAEPVRSSKTPYADATAPCGQKSLSIGKKMPSRSASARWA